MHDVNCEDCRVLIVDDNRSFHNELREALRPRIAKMDGEQAGGESRRCRFEIVSAYHGQEACRAIRDAEGAGRRIDLAFVAIRMPTGWDRVGTIEQLWKIVAELQVVISGGLSDASWRSIAERLGHDANAILLRDPLDKRTVSQLVAVLNQKRRSFFEMNLKQSNFERVVEQVCEDRSNECAARQIQPIDGEQSWAADQAELRQELHHELRAAISALTHASELAGRVAPVAPCEAVEREPTLVREIIDELVETNQRLTGDRVLLKFGMSAGSATISADRPEIHAALMYLCCCAADAMPLGNSISIDANIVDATNRSSLTVQPGRGRPVPRHVAIRISDSGRSIPITVRDRLFEPFLAPQRTARRAEPYCSTVYEIIKRHGGWIEIESSFAVGTTIVINLPLVDEPAAVPGALPRYESLDLWSRRHPAVSSMVLSVPRGQITATCSIYHFPR